METKIGSSRWPYVLSLLIFILGIAVFIILLITNISSIANSNQQIVIPGKQELVLDKPGKYIIFLEYKSSIDNGVYSIVGDVSGLVCSVKDISNNKNIHVIPSASNSKYSFGNREGKSVLEFNIDKPGTYEVSGGYKGNSPGPQVVIAVGKSFVGRILKLVFGEIIVLSITIMTTAFIIVSTYSKRKKQSRMSY